MSDIDTVAVDSLKVLDPKRPIREATELLDRHEPRNPRGAILADACHHVFNVAARCVFAQYLVQSHLIEDSKSE